MDYREAGGLDRIDSEVQRREPVVRLRAVDLLLGTRAALGLRPLTAPALLFVPLGIALGPHGLGLLTGAALATVGPVVTVALAALGVFIGLALTVDGRRDRRLLAAASLEALVTLAAVGMASAWLMTRWGVPLDTSALLVATVLGVAASVSSSGGPEIVAGPVHATATRIADLDDGFAVVAGTIAVAAVHGGSAAGTFAVVVTTALVGALAGFAGWLLFERARSEAERAVFVLGTLSLIGGAAEYVRCSPLFAGLVAGLLWRVLPGGADRIVHDDVGRFQHPLVVMLLVTAGALMDVTALAVWLLVPFVIFRLLGKVLGAWIGSLLVPGLRLTDLAAYLLPPGLIGIALALSLLQVSPSPTATAVVSAVALGTLASELLAAFALPGGADH